MIFLFENGNFIQQNYLKFLEIPESLEKSFRNSGILYPVLYAQIDHNYIIIDGIKRLKFILSNNIEKNLKKISITNINNAIILRKQLSEFNLLEKLEILNSFKDCSLYNNIFKLLGLQKNKYIKKFINNISKFPEQILYAMANNKIKSKNLDRWSVFDIKEILNILQLTETIAFNANQERLLLDYLLHIKANSNNLTIVFNQLKKLAISEQTAPHKIKNILDYLNNICYPDYKKAIEKFYSLKKKLHLPNNMNINFLSNGEDNQFNFEFCFTNLKELNNSIKELNNIKNSMEIKQILNIFS